MDPNHPYLGTPAPAPAFVGRIETLSRTTPDLDTARDAVTFAALLAALVALSRAKRRLSLAASFAAMIGAWRWYSEGRAEVRWWDRQDHE